MQKKAKRFQLHAILGLSVAITFVACLDKKDDNQNVVPRTGAQLPVVPPKVMADRQGETKGLAGRLFAPTGTDDLIQKFSKGLDASALDFARTIISLDATLDVGDKSITIQMQRTSLQDKAVQVDALKGTLDGQQALLKSEDGKLKGLLRCLSSAEAACPVMIVDILDGAEQGKLKSRAVIRRTKANFNFSKEPNITESEGFKRIVELFDTTLHNSQTANSIKLLLVDSTEVIGGVSQVQISIVSNENEVIGLKGDLVLQSSATTTTKVTMEKNINVNALLGLVDTRDIKKNLQDLIVGADIVDIKEGKNLTVNIGVVGNDENKKPQTLSLSLSRIQPKLGKVE